jgi:hypothetical protein
MIFKIFKGVTKSVFIKKLKIYFVVLGIKPSVLCLLDKCSTTEVLTKALNFLRNTVTISSLEMHSKVPHTG